MRVRHANFSFALVCALAAACNRSGAPDPAVTGLNSAPLAVGTTTDVAVSGTLFAVRVNESQQFASNLNGAANFGTHNDADTSDKVVFVYHTENQTAKNLALAGSDPGNLLFLGDFLAFTVNEAAEGNAPLDNDGAASDEDVLHLYNVKTDSKINTAQAVVKGTLWGDDKILAFELQSGNLGWVRLATPSTVFDSGVALLASAAPGKDYVVGGGYIVFLDSGSIPRAIDTVSVAPPVSIGGGLAAKAGSLHLDEEDVVYLQAEGAADKNGDGDTDDFFPTVSDLLDETLGVSSTTSLSIEAVSSSFRASGDRVAFLRNEADSGAGGTDHNDDGDTLDSVLFWFDVDSPASFENTMLAGQEIALTGRTIAVTVPELNQENSASGVEGDLNDDGDVGQDRALFLVDTDVSPASFESLEIDAEGLAIGSKLIAFGSNESLQGEDLNGDGTINAGTIVSHAVGLEIQIVRNLRWQADSTLAVGRRAFFRIPEGQFGFGDLNGDDDQNDSVVGYYDLSDADGKTTAGAVQKGGFFGVAVDDTLFVFLADESDSDKDLNGDSDKLDRVVRFLKFP